MKATTAQSEPSCVGVYVTASVSDAAAVAVIREGDADKEIAGLKHKKQEQRYKMIRNVNSKGNMMERIAVNNKKINNSRAGIINGKNQSRFIFINNGFNDYLSCLIYNTKFIRSNL